ncbi:MAG: hypothetical protein CMJ59_10010 [Planctomycetaceae bacterium]|nr:hypothetical protein [Planctomycetaceae bacterium]
MNGADWVSASSAVITRERNDKPHPCPRPTMLPGCDPGFLCPDQADATQPTRRISTSPSQ